LEVSLSGKLEKRVQECDDFTWYIQTCGSQFDTTLLVSKAKNLDTNLCIVTSTTSVCNTEFYVNPCDATATASRPSCAQNRDGGSLQILNVGFQPRLAAPTIKIKVNYEEESESISLNLTLSTAGYVSCGLFTKGVIPSSIAQVKAQRHSVISTGNRSVLYITDLLPLHDYQVFCYMKGFNGAETTLADLLRNNHSLSTPCCKKLVVDVFVTKVIQNSPELLNSLRIKISNLPSNNIQLFLSLLIITMDM